MDLFGYPDLPAALKSIVLATARMGTDAELTLIAGHTRHETLAVHRHVDGALADKCQAVMDLEAGVWKYQAA
jgi:hypothetical protein